MLKIIKTKEPTIANKKASMIYKKNNLVTTDYIRGKENEV